VDALSVRECALLLIAGDSARWIRHISGRECPSSLVARELSRLNRCDALVGKPLLLVTSAHSLYLLTYNNLGRK
jgi:hypothetical protein